MAFLFHLEVENISLRDLLDLWLQYCNEIYSPLAQYIELESP